MQGVLLCFFGVRPLANHPINPMVPLVSPNSGDTSARRDHNVALSSFFSSVPECGASGPNHSP